MLTDRAEPIGAAGYLRTYRAQCPLWARSRHLRRKKLCPLYPQYRPRKRTPANGHVCFTPESGPVRCTSWCLL